MAEGEEGVAMDLTINGSSHNVDVPYQMPVAPVGARAITPIEGVGATPAGARIQKVWLELEVIQCGYCQPGQIMSAAALLAANPHPDDAAIDAAMAGNLCRCGTYVRIREGIKHAARS